MNTPSKLVDPEMEAAKAELIADLKRQIELAEAILSGEQTDSVTKEDLSAAFSSIQPAQAG